MTTDTREALAAIESDGDAYLRWLQENGMLTRLGPASFGSSAWHAASKRVRAALATPAAPAQPERMWDEFGRTNAGDETGGAVQRFGFDISGSKPDIIPATNGAFVHYSDYLALHRRLNAPPAQPEPSDSTGAMAAAWFGTPGTEKAVNAVFGPRAAQPEPSDTEILVLADKLFPRWREDIQTQFVLRLARAVLSDAAKAAAQPESSWDASKIKQPGWHHVEAAFIEGVREAKANPSCEEGDIRRAADGYTKRVFEEVDPASEEALRTESWVEPAMPPWMPEHQQWRMSSIIEAAWEHDANKLALALRSMPATRAEIEAEDAAQPDEDSELERATLRSMMAAQPEQGAQPVMWKIITAGGHTFFEEGNPRNLYSDKWLSRCKLVQPLGPIASPTVQPVAVPAETDKRFYSALAAMERAFKSSGIRDGVKHYIVQSGCNDWNKTRAASPQPVQAVALTDEQIDNLRGLDTASRVRFYEHDFYVLSNFSAFTLVWKGIRFDTSEAAYHYEKFTGNSGSAQLTRHFIQTAPSAHEAFKVAERNKTLRRPDWDAVKVGIMLDILRAKAEQHEYVRRKLLATDDRELVEDSWRDEFWGWGPNRDGKNMLGRLWMQVRSELRGIAPKATQEPNEQDEHAPKGSARSDS